MDFSSQIMCVQTCRIDCFQVLNNNAQVVQQMLAAAIADPTLTSLASPWHRMMLVVAARFGSVECAKVILDAGVATANTFLIDIDGSICSVLEFGLLQPDAIGMTTLLMQHRVNADRFRRISSSGRDIIHANRNLYHRVKVYESKGITIGDEVIIRSPDRASIRSNLMAHTITDKPVKATGKLVDIRVRQI
jgi:hypothetical protein